MIKLMSTNGQVQYDHDEWVVDKEEDLKLLPKKSGMGSVAIVISTGKVYMKDSSGEWKEISYGFNNICFIKTTDIPRRS